MQANELRRKISGFDYMLRQLDLQSAVGRDALSGLQWYGPGQEGALGVELGRVEALKRYMAGRATVPLDKFKLKLSQIWDIRPSFALLEQGLVDDVQLFEIKRFALLVGDAGRHLAEVMEACWGKGAADSAVAGSVVAGAGSDWEAEVAGRGFAGNAGGNLREMGLRGVDDDGGEGVPEVFPDLLPVVEVLDPRGERLPVFHIYDEYDTELAGMRARLLELDAEAAEAGAAGDAPVRAAAGDGLKPVDEEVARLQTACLEAEQRVRAVLAERLRPYVPLLRKAMDLVAYWDMLVAKAGLAWKFDLVLPEIKPVQRDAKVAYRGLFHPMVKALLEERKARYQAVDVVLEKGPCLLTGANMSGKTVLLKSLALSQCLLQTGFLVPAVRASLPLFEAVALLVQDEQDEERGLSSFGAEMQRLNGVLERLRKGERLLLLADELARTTNPLEGKAMVCAVLDTLQELPCCAMVSTHYGPIPNQVRHLRVRGFREDWALGQINPMGSSPKTKESAVASERFDINRIQACMDYSLVEEKPGEMPPMEALRIASLLGFDEKVLEKARAYYNREI